MEVASRLPEEMLLKLFKYLDTKSLLSLSACCKFWYEAINFDTLWKYRYEKLNNIYRHPLIDKETDLKEVIECESIVDELSFTTKFKNKCPTQESNTKNVGDLGPICEWKQNFMKLRRLLNNLKHRNYTTINYSFPDGRRAKALDDLSAILVSGRNMILAVYDLPSGKLHCSRLRNDTDIKEQACDIAVSSSGDEASVLFGGGVKHCEIGIFGIKDAFLRKHIIVNSDVDAFCSWIKEFYYYKNNNLVLIRNDIKEINVWDTTKFVDESSEPTIIVWPFPRGKSLFRYSSKLIASTSLGQAVIVDLENPQATQILCDHVYDSYLSIQGTKKTCAIVDSRGWIGIWDIETRKCRHRITLQYDLLYLSKIVMDERHIIVPYHSGIFQIFCLDGNLKCELNLGLDFFGSRFVIMGDVVMQCMEGQGMGMLDINAKMNYSYSGSLDPGAVLLSYDFKVTRSKIFQAWINLEEFPPAPMHAKMVRFL